MATTVYVLNGPNLNLLGTREPDVYGRTTLKDVEAMCRDAGRRHGFDIVFHQSNHEGALVDWVQEARAKGAAGIVINPAAYTHTSIAILDAVLAADIPTIEVHISNVHARDAFRRHSYISPAAKAVICGFGVNGYVLAIDGLAAMLTSSKG
jgi:3-dehydroquinate dehydratase-2